MFDIIAKVFFYSISILRGENKEEKFKFSCVFDGCAECKNRNARFNTVVFEFHLEPLELTGSLSHSAWIWLISSGLTAVI